MSRRFVHAGPSVAEGQQGITPGADAWKRRKIAPVSLYKARLDEQAPATRHCVLGVHGQIENHLFQLMRVRIHLRAFGTKREAHLHVFSQQAPEHRLHVLEQVVQIQHSWLQNLLPAEGQQLAGQACCALPGFVDLFQLFPERIVDPQFGERHYAVAIDHRQQVVEVVGHSARQASDRLHFLCLD